MRFQRFRMYFRISGSFHVLLAIGLKHEEAHGSLRLTLSEESTKEEMDIVAEEVKKIVQRLRDMSPLYEDFLKSQKNN